MRPAGGDMAQSTTLQDIGLLEVGCEADFVVYGKNLYSVSPDMFDRDNPKVVSTWVGGRKVYEPK